VEGTDKGAGAELVDVLSSVGVVGIPKADDGMPSAPGAAEGGFP
jgi:hypothetical protein